jgi:hypothetical protein
MWSLIPSVVGCFAGVGLSTAWLGSSLIGRREEEEEGWDGAMVMAARPLRTGSIVFFHDQTHRNMGFARVRHCTPRSANEFQVGLEFEGQLMQSEPGTWHIQRIAQD